MPAIQNYHTRAIIMRSLLQVYDKLYLQILTIHKDRNFCKNLLENKEMVFKNGVKNIQAAAYNGAHTVVEVIIKSYAYFSLFVSITECAPKAISIFLVCTSFVGRKRLVGSVLKKLLLLNISVYLGRFV